ncbi:homing endonuclease associated repeat-containing protein [Bacillus cereus group sp. TH152-1LC]|uniref:homing endonuclease associated repeat-containing protein n=1 Tax=Bacillus cereus group sp. TH152-1LC TaxID=3018060 RepID=UPI0022E2DF73|nr:hypothetical protein [Bacillus cereus group sp. TH152-1LC]MDA1675183.1 hypothetical protein [Bacillus cereus group sp. TH152-1LC]
MKQVFSNLENQILVQIMEVAEENDGVASMREYVDSGRIPDIDTVITVFGSWNNAVNIIDYVPYVESDVTIYQEDIIRQMRGFYEENNNHITLELFKKRYKKEGFKHINRAFGSWNNALRVANIEQGQYTERIYSKEFIIQNIRGLHANSGSVYYTKQNYIDSKAEPDIKTVLREFGIWSNVLKQAGLPFRGNVEEIEKKHAEKKKEIIEQLRELAEEYKGKITIRVYRDSNRSPKADTIVNYFGTWQDALKAAGIYQYIKSIVTEEDALHFKMYAIRQLQLHNNEYVGKIDKDSYRASGRLPTVTSIYRVFGSWTQAIHEAQITSAKQKSPRYPDEDKFLETIKQELNKFYEETGSLSERLYKELGRKPSATTIRRVVGDWKTALNISGLSNKPVKRPLKDNQKEWIVKQLTEFYEETGSVSERLYKKSGRRPSATTIRRLIGTWQDAILYANLQSKTSRTKD